VNYEQTLDYLFSQLPMYQRIGKAAYKANLDNTIALCNLLGNPQDKFKSIHVAGTNGKGSTAHFLASIMQEHGLKTGLYTSPHLVDFRERIRINGKMVPKEFVIEFVSNHKSEFENIKPSFFEMTAGMAFDYFAEEEVDIAIIEVGMGGRLDSTNVIAPEISVITNIGFDHMQFLGRTLRDIAKEKAAIIKRGIPVIIGEKQEEVSDIFIEKANTEGSDILYASDYLQSANERMMGNGMAIDILKNDEIFIPDLYCPLSGKYLIKNIITSIGIVEAFNRTGHEISIDLIRSGIDNVTKNTGLRGRWQVIADKPLTICDVGHNYNGLKMTMQQLGGLSYKQLHFVLGSVNDKELEGILKLLPPDAIFYFCKPDIPRGLDEHELMKLAQNAGLSGEAFDSVKNAYSAAKAGAKRDDIIFIGGSTFVVAEALAC